MYVRLCKETLKANVALILSINVVIYTFNRRIRFICVATITSDSTVHHKGYKNCLSFGVFVFS